MNVSIFGLGKVGHALACCLSAAGNRVIGYDPVSGIVEALNNRAYETYENEVAERLASINVGDLSATSSMDEAVISSDVTMIIVPTPSNALNGFSLRFVLEACAGIGNAMQKKTTPHCVGLVSTVLPGASELYIVPALETASGRKIGDGLAYCYNPSFIALGEVVTGFERPDYVLIGEADSASGDTVAALHRSVLRNDAPIVRMKPIEAEITKIASNTHETMRVAFANMLFSVCSELPAADVDVITGALAYRMGRRFFKGAVPYGGPCWPRDNRAFAAFMDAVGVPSVMPRTIDVSNEEHGRYVLRKVLSLADRGDTVGLLGLSYKPGTNVIDCAFGVRLADWLLQDGRKVVAWDPMALGEARALFGDRIAYADSPENCLRSAKIAVIVNPMPELASVAWSAARSAVVMDPWRCLSPAMISQIGTHVAMGRGMENSMRGGWPAQELAERLRLLNS